MAVVLVVDDEPDVRLALVTLLEAEGHAVIEAEDGSEVFPVARDKMPDIVLLDIAMPIMDGYEALRQLKADAGTRDIPVIMVAARTGSEDRARGRELGACDYIAKPWSEGEVELRTEWVLRINSWHGGAQGAPDVSNLQPVPI